VHTLLQWTLVAAVRLLALRRLLLLVAAPAAVTMMKTTARQRAGACAQRNPSRLGFCKSCAGWQSKPGSSLWLWMRLSWHTLLLVHHVLATVLMTQISTRGSGSFSSSSQRSRCRRLGKGTQPRRCTCFLRPHFTSRSGRVHAANLAAEAAAAEGCQGCSAADGRREGFARCLSACFI